MNQLIVSKFKANKYGNSLEKYLKECAWTEDLDGETRVYLIKDPNNQVALYFSLKCGLLYEPYTYSNLDSQKQDFVTLIFEALKNDDHEIVEGYMKSEYYPPDEADRLYKMALDQLEVKRENIALKDECSTYKVSKCFSAIELRHFCKNEDYVPNDNIEIPLGFGLFWEVIVPKICEITDLVGCKYLYLFAADNTANLSNKEYSRKLLDYYKNDLKFHDVKDKVIIKPQYDRFCFGLVQEISELKNNREAIWEEFSDV